ncbi:hypothetical protein [Longimicrobium terrae]|uniref:Uncharacterized protein n=1 Tax=Longimicrobium terrae TaxID=1639882 RepID=A0A841H5W3_9BACT|nr:hypothetical protein [Longimicrobium terrae]MBB4638196.1 hypothetical protein [Longimicrobium terrae]MBB6073645.1 hypothetical protein [Longimicrobium terrae]NNC30324.1 hypothetical protein [Longimicrobium terrae]
MDARPAAHANALIVLAGHADAPAHLSVVRATGWSRVRRTAIFATAWISGSITMFIITLFDPFMTALPFLIGAWMTGKSWSGRYRVMSFEGACPRCHHPIQLKPGARIAAPHPLVCYHCHHEPKLFLTA